MWTSHHLIQSQINWFLFSRSFFLSNFYSYTLHAMMMMRIFIFLWWQRDAMKITSIRDNFISSMVHRSVSGVNNLSIVEINLMYTLFSSFFSIHTFNIKWDDKQIQYDEIKSDIFTFNKQHSQMKSEIFFFFFFFFAAFSLPLLRWFELFKLFVTCKITYKLIKLLFQLH